MWLLSNGASKNYLLKAKEPIIYFGTKNLITTVIFCSNLNATAPKTSGRKLERRRSICVDTVLQIVDNYIDCDWRNKSFSIPLNKCQFQIGIGIAIC